MIEQKILKDFDSGIFSYAKIAELNNTSMTSVKRIIDKKYAIKEFAFKSKPIKVNLDSSIETDKELINLLIYKKNNPKTAFINGLKQRINYLFRLNFERQLKK